VGIIKVEFLKENRICYGDFTYRIILSFVRSNICKKMKILKITFILNLFKKIEDFSFLK
jgi:hypothetical protein